MNITKQAIQEVLEGLSVPGEGQNLMASGAVKNINTFGDEVVIDLVLKNPSLQARKKVEVEILKSIHSKVYNKAKITTNVKVETPPKVDAPIKGEPIKGISSIVAISSGKGGVGKSTVTSNIAVTLSQMGFKVGVLDADIYGPSIPTMMDMEGERPLSVTIDGKSKMQPIENYGVKVLSIGFFTQPNQAVIWRGPMASKALNQMIFDAAWGELDFLLIDLPPGTGDIHLSIVQSLPISGAVVVSTPQNVALADAKKGIAMFQQDSIQVPVLGVVENMAYFTPEELPENKYYIFGKEGAKNLATDTQVPFLGEIPLVQSVREAGDVGRPAALQENSPVADSIYRITQNMVAQVLDRNKNLPPTQVVKITTMSGCSAVKK
ncbi:Mrp/NBP35 family ATP-binding protein [Flavobacteriaceae bacterium]|uniref:Mrp/NBP35 family ATP-binding protein n=1 Tax=Candidatus Arcticimaribacter forsetii TaxID=2820661 RepID=UPI0020776C02|nr:Mrp/NBP35 family ATP-binding protein [Candidatus Arcticimaribacter forsetii]MDA8698730.1 Mrp/NBP35 family ATP-binding protein [Flavobacteriaceae bacterium]MDB2325697.1 Mrp/NBP35 family ATP-binding protein [Flavobacteriaceae bacterium]MDB2329216.1 Mrp/NBP35 family ATP-binding protein [Flavobacteriaceae bacterium]MDB2345858.1 Mrp/NBP35 family ATP-binding protein [Flavobacteriaceae bacterium]MDB4674667.1 Mrp/NBP35 family ATP-binding protein [Flavobacteriaceae bacterium]